MQTIKNKNPPKPVTSICIVFAKQIVKEHCQIGRGDLSVAIAAHRFKTQAGSII